MLIGRRRGLACAAIVLLSGCAGSQPFGQQGPTPQNALVQSHAALGRAWIRPGVSHANLVYVSNPGNGTVTVYSWPGAALVGSLGEFNALRSLCADEAGDVFVLDSSTAQISEYSHGGTSPIQVLNDPNRTPYSCSVDPKTGNLAVANAGDVSIYLRASGSPAFYTVPDTDVLFVSYDHGGNLFAEGKQTGAHGDIVFNQMPYGGSSFGALTLNETVKISAGLHWDGTVLDVGETGTTSKKIYQFSISGTNGTLTNTIHLDGLMTFNDFFVGRVGPDGQPHPNRKVFAAGFASQQVPYFSYPAGGTPIDAITDGVSFPLGVTISKGT